MKPELNIEYHSNQISSGAGTSSAAAFASYNNEISRFIVQRGFGRDKLNFTIRVFVQDGNKRYKLVCLNPNDDTDYRELEPPMHSTIIREQFLQQDINEKLKIYVDSNGKIDYLALVDPTMNDF